MLYGLFCQFFLNLGLYDLHLGGGLEAGYHLALLVDEELGEVPLDVGLLLVVGVCLAEHVVQNSCQVVLGIPAGEAFLLLQELVQGICILAVDLDLLETRELGAEVQLAELMDAFIGARSLLSELVAGEVENLEALAVILLVKGLQLVVLWGSLPFLSFTEKS